MSKKPENLSRAERDALASMRPLNAVEQQIHHLTQRAKAFIEEEVSDTDAGRKVFNKLIKESLSELETPQQRFELLEELRKQAQQRGNSFAPFKNGIVAEHEKITEERTKAATKIQSIARVKPAQKKLAELKDESKQAQAKKEAEDSIAELNNKTLEDIIPNPEKYTENSEQYRADTQLTTKRSARMDTLLKIEDRVASIVRTNTATPEDKRFLKQQITNLTQDSEDNHLINKHMGSILRSELQKQGIKVKRTWGQFFTDKFQNNAKGHEALRKAGVDISKLVSSMQNHARTKDQTEQSQLPTNRNQVSSGRGV